MNLVAKEQHQTGLDMVGKSIPVTRLTYQCPICQTIHYFYMREDGKEGDFHKLLNVSKKMQQRMEAFEALPDEKE